MDNVDNMKAGSEPKQEIAGYEQAEIDVGKELDERTKGLESNPEAYLKAYNGYFQNFHLRLPGGGPAYDEYRKQVSGIPVSEDQGYSKRRAGETGEEFYKDVDQTVADSEKAAKVVEKPIDIRGLMATFTANPTTLNTFMLNSAALDTLIRLRAKGYNIKDLNR